MCSDALKESSDFKPAKGTRWFVSISSIPPPDVIFSLRFRADVQPIKSSTCQQINSKTEFKVSREYITVKGGEKSILRVRGDWCRIEGRKLDGELKGEVGSSGFIVSGYKEEQDEG